MHDQSEYYWQFACQKTADNLIALPLPGPSYDTTTPHPTAEPERDPAGYPADWQCYVSDVCQFGAVGSVMGCCWTSDLLSACLGFLFHVCASMYIDDSTTLERRATFPLVVQFIELFFTAIGFRISHDKTELSLEWEVPFREQVQRIVTSLGIEIGYDRYLFFGVPAVKLAECRSRLDGCIAGVRDGSLQWRQLKSAVGLFLHVTCLSKLLTPFARATDQWSLENFDKFMQSPSMKKSLVLALTNMRVGTHSVRKKYIREPVIVRY